MEAFVPGRSSGRGLPRRIARGGPQGRGFQLSHGRAGVLAHREDHGISWYDFTCRYVDLKWKAASAKYRRAIAQALAAATPVMIPGSYGRPDDKILRGALVNWGYNSGQRASAPEDIADAEIARRLRCAHNPWGRPRPGIAARAARAWSRSSRQALFPGSGSSRAPRK